jgi:hypothetical protein
MSVTIKHFDVFFLYVGNVNVHSDDNCTFDVRAYKGAMKNVNSWN